MPESPWWPLRFNLSPLLLAGWVVFSFTLGVFLGAAIRRTLPAMAATLVCYGAVLFEVSASWRMHYLPPLHRAVAVQFQPGGVRLQRLLGATSARHHERGAELAEMDAC